MKYKHLYYQKRSVYIISRFIHFRNNNFGNLKFHQANKFMDCGPLEPQFYMVKQRGLHGYKFLHFSSKHTLLVHFKTTVLTYTHNVSVEQK